MIRAGETQAELLRTAVGRRNADVQGRWFGEVGRCRYDVRCPRLAVPAPSSVPPSSLDGRIVWRLDGEGQADPIKRSVESDGLNEASVVVEQLLDRFWTPRAQGVDELLVQFTPDGSTDIDATATLNG